jgi:uncharacterized membrane protein YoaK (UPF0700 family)
MTGNTVLLGMALGQEHSQAAIRSSLALAGFLVGVACGAWTASRGRHDDVWAPAVTASLALETILLVVFAGLWYLAGEPDATAAATACLIVLSALAMGLQSAVARRLNIPGVATTYITGTLTTLVAGLVAGHRGAPASRTAREHTVRTAYAVESAPDTGLLAATWVVYTGGAAVVSLLISFQGSLLALALPIILLTAVTLTALVYFRGP